jgi:hypothetical protein
MRLHSIGILASSCVAIATAGAQSVIDGGAHAGPQFVQYQLKSPVDVKISELAIPLWAFVPITKAFSVDVGTAFASSRVQATIGDDSKISGLTDTQVRASYVIGNDAVVLTAGLNLPTGQSTAKVDQLAAATFIGNDFLAFPVTSMGSGFGFTGGAAFARSAGAWNLGLGASVRASSAYDPFEIDNAGTKLRYVPGNEYRGRVGADRLAGSGRVSLGLTYSTFGREEAGGSAYNSGDRWIAQASYGGVVGSGQLTLAAWDLYRASGTVGDSTKTGREQIVNALVAYGFRPNGVLIEPSIEGRVWTQQGFSSSNMVNLGVRTQFTAGQLSITPAARYSLGKVAGIGASADLTGWQMLVSFGLGR